MLLTKNNDAGPPAELQRHPGEVAGERAREATPAPSLHPAYRPDIDGLRAIAVGSVVIFHAFPEWFEGGFIGVDVFFVISGYLISLILFKNLEHGRFSIVDFYVRRVRRIFPALMTVMSLCLVAGWFVLFADEYKQLGKHLFGGSTFISNFLFWRESGYFDNSAETKPLLHLWSLAIEEQFYLFWPPLLALVYKRRWGFLRIMGVIGLISFGINLYLIGHDQSAAFYSPLARFWELMVGGALAYLSLHRPELTRGHQNLQAWLGLALLVAGFALLDGQRAFPGWWALLPAVGAFLLLSAGSQAWFNRRVLASRGMVGVGLISYPLYLWHWPLLAFATIIEGQSAPPSWRAAAVAVALLLSWLTYRYIERPLRHSGHRRTVLVLLAMNVVVGLAGMTIYLKGGFEERGLNQKLDYLGRSDLFEGSRNSDGSCERNNGMAGVDEEVCLSNSTAPRTLFVGDSHVMALHSAIFSGDVKMPAMMVAGHACRLYPNLPYTPTYLLRWANNCTAIANEAIAAARRLPSIQTVVISAAYPREDLGQGSEYRQGGRTLSRREAFLAGYGALIEAFQKAGKRVVFVPDVPYLKLDPHACVSRFSDGQARECGYTEAEHHALRQQYDAAVAELQRRHPQVAFFDPQPLFCQQGKCVAKLGEAYLYNDNQHISLSASRLLLEQMHARGLLPATPAAP